MWVVVSQNYGASIRGEKTLIQREVVSSHCII